MRIYDYKYFTKFISNVIVYSLLHILYLDLLCLSLDLDLLRRSLSRDLDLDRRLLFGVLLDKNDSVYYSIKNESFAQGKKCKHFASSNIPVPSPCNR